MMISIVDLLFIWGFYSTIRPLHPPFRIKLPSHILLTNLQVNTDIPCIVVLFAYIHQIPSPYTVDLNTLLLFFCVCCSILNSWDILPMLQNICKRRWGKRYFLHDGIPIWRVCNNEQSNGNKIKLLHMCMSSTVLNGPLLSRVMNHQIPQ